MDNSLGASAGSSGRPSLYTNSSCTGGISWTSYRRRSAVITNNFNLAVATVVSAEGEGNDMLWYILTYSMEQSPS
jgi:hypothetical protein